jgi:hypothetical protein
LDADDLLHPAKLQLQLDALRPEQGLALSICDYYVCDAHNVYKRISDGHDFEHPRLRDPNPLIDLALRWETDLSIPIHCFLFDARLFRESNIWFDDTLPNHEDWDCWMRIFRLRPRVAHIARELAVYRRHAGSMTRARRAMWNGYMLAIRKQLSASGNDRALRRALKQKSRRPAENAPAGSMGQSRRQEAPWMVLGNNSSSDAEKHVVNPLGRKNETGVRVTDLLWWFRL